MKNIMLAGLIGLAIFLSGCDGTKAGPTSMSKWKTLGELSDGCGSATLFWTVNEETGDRVYVLVGEKKAGVFVIPTTKPAEEAPKPEK